MKEIEFKHGKIEFWFNWHCWGLPIMISLYKDEWWNGSIHLFCLVIRYDFWRVK